MSEEAWEEGDLAHIVSPASKWNEVLQGKKKRVRALCGKFVRHAVPTAVPVCRGCFEEQMKRDVASADDIVSAKAG